MMKFTSIRIVICYFGKWPEWFNLFLKSCAFNPTVEFLIFTDCIIPEYESRNVKFIAFNLSAFNQLASQKLHLRINVEKPYKLCDFKPAYGIIFEDYLEGAHFWGCSDLDVIFGNIRKFISERVLSCYDVITAKKQYLLGHFTLYKNCDEVNHLYEQSEDYVKVFESQRNFCFDECNFLWWYILKGKSISSIKYEIDSMSHVVKRLCQQGHIKAFFKSLMLEQDQLTQSGKLADWNEQLLWKEGKLINTNNNREYLYLHFHFLKRLTEFKIPEWEIIPDSFYVSSAGFYT